MSAPSSQGWDFCPHWDIWASPFRTTALKVPPQQGLWSLCSHLTCVLSLRDHSTALPYYLMSENCCFMCFIQFGPCWWWENWFGTSWKQNHFVDFPSVHRVSQEGACCVFPKFLVFLRRAMLLLVKELFISNHINCLIMKCCFQYFAF